MNLGTCLAQHRFSSDEQRLPAVRSSGLVQGLPAPSTVMNELVLDVVDGGGGGEEIGGKKAGQGSCGISSQAPALLCDFVAV